MDIAVIKTLTKTLGSLALSSPYLKRLGLAQIIDNRTTDGKEREVSTVQVTEVLVLNRLTVKPTPISQISSWAQGQVTAEVSGFPADAFNDARIGRALHEIYPHLAAAWVSLVLPGAQAYRIDLRQLPSDVTRIVFEGADDPPPGTTPAVAIPHGYNGREDPPRTQVPVSLNVAADSAVPAGYELADGDAANCRAYLTHRKAAQELLHLTDVLIVGDRQLATGPNILGFCRAQARFVAPRACLSTASRWQGDARAVCGPRLALSEWEERFGSVAAG